MVDVIPAERIEKRIFLIRGQKVMLDSDLAKLYEVPTRRLNEQVKRNPKRFPPDFMLQLTPKEAESLRSHFATSNPGRGGRRYLPYAFTEQGIAMLSSVLTSERAILVNVEIMRAFVRLRHILATHKDLARKLEELEMKYDEQFKVPFFSPICVISPLFSIPSRRRTRLLFDIPTRGKRSARLAFPI